MYLRKFLVTWLAVLLSTFVWTGLARAVTITAPGSFTIDWLLADAGGSGFDLEATADFTVTSVSPTQIQIDVTVTNNTDSAFQAAILALGFYANPDVTASFVTTGGTFDSIEQGINFPGGFNSIDVCVFAANNCQGGNVNDGLQSGGNADTFTLLLTGDFGATPSLTLDTFPIKFQTSAGSFEFGGGEGGGDPVPEPGTILLLGSGLIGLGLSQRRKRAR